MRFCRWPLAVFVAAVFVVSLAAADEALADNDQVSFTKEVRIVFSDDEVAPDARVLTGEHPVREGTVEDAKVGDVVEGEIQDEEAEKEEDATKETEVEEDGEAENAEEVEEEGEEEEFVVIDDTARMAAEKLIHELDEISNKLKDDETIGTSRAISSADVSSLEKLLRTAGLTPDSALLKNLQQNLQTLQLAQNRSGVAPVPNLGGLGGLGALGNMGAMSGLAGGMGGMGGMAGLGGLLAPSMTKKNVEEIKAELKDMLFGPDVPKRTGEADRRQEPKRRPLFRNPRPSLRNRHPAPVPAPGRAPAPAPGRAPAPAPGRSPFTFGANNQAAAPVQNRPVDRQPISEFRSPPTDFRLPEAPFRNSVVFNQPQQPTSNDFRNTFLRPNNGQHVITPPPLRVSQPQRPFNPSPLDRPAVIAPRPTEEEFRPVLVGGNRQVQSQPSQPAVVRQPAPQQTLAQFQRPATQFQQPNQFLQPTVRLPTPQQPHVQQHAPAPIVPAQRQPFQPQPTQRNPPFQQAPTVQQFQPPPAQRAPAPQQPPPAARPPPFSASLPTVGGIFSGNFDAPSGLNPSGSSAVTTKNKFVPDCNLFSEGICLEVRNYPHEVLSNLLSRNRPALDTMLAEVRSQSADDLTDGISAAEERKYSYTHYYGNRKQGEDTHAHRDFAEDGGFLCPSEVRYARPQLAQTSRGNWKYIINMGEHTQTLRMERCLKPNDGCSYVSPHYKSHCIQVYNYHRLLSFDDKKGMHIDIYKIPVGCSCHIHGYAYLYPPLDGKAAGHILPPAFNNLNDTAAKRKSASNERQQVITRDRSDHTASSAPKRQPVEEEEQLAPPGFRDFHAFMNQQFGDRLTFQAGATKERKPTNNRRVDNDEGVTYVDSARPSRPKTNYDYHPIIDFFNDKPSSSLKS